MTSSLRAASGRRISYRFSVTVSVLGVALPAPSVTSSSTFSLSLRVRAYFLRAARLNLAMTLNDPALVRAPRPLPSGLRLDPSATFAVHASLQVTFSGSPFFRSAASLDLPERASDTVAGVRSPPSCGGGGGAVGAATLIVAAADRV